MADYKVSDTSLTSIANAIRTKGGTSASLSFPDGFVTAIGNISTGGSATLITKSITANGTYNASSDSADGYSSVTVAVPGLPFVVGTFTAEASEVGTAKDISINYSGSGYPISCLIYPTAGAYKSGTSIYSSTDKKAILTFSFAKSDMSEAPDYTSNASKNFATAVGLFKNNDTDPTVLSATNSRENLSYYNSVAQSSSAATTVRFKNATTLSVFIFDANKYGFLAGTEYTYVIQYSA